MLQARSSNGTVRMFEVRALRVPGSSSSRIALFYRIGTCSINTPAFPFSLCFFVQAAFGLRTPCFAVLFIGPILRPFDPAIFLVFDMGEESGGGGGGRQPPCPESEAASPRPGALDLPPHVSTASYFVWGGSLCRVLHLIYIHTYSRRRAGGCCSPATSCDQTVVFTTHVYKNAL